MLTGTSFSQVVLRTWSLITIKWQGVLVGAIFFSMLSAMVAATVDLKIQAVEDRISSAAGMTWEQLHDAVDVRLSTLDQTGMKVIVERMRNGKTVPSSGEKSVTDTASNSFIIGVGPWILLSFAVNAFIAFLAFTFFLTLATGGMETPFDSARRLPRMVLPMVGIVLLFFFRSLLWIPFFGLFIALYLVPRFILAPVMYAAGETTLCRSFHESFRRTSGRWLFMTFTLVGLCLMTFLFMWFGLMFVAAITLFSLKLGLILWLFLLTLSLAFQAFFLTTLTASIG